MNSYEYQKGKKNQMEFKQNKKTFQLKYEIFYFYELIFIS